ncbi:hypothetical protein [Thermoflavimicrobium daqui]|uniref:t-SNARE coiled-coil homology domain-containing protein n=1 Tax=Thermoflavimicrobium daqui TaxID=2137476 RepID=A0A364K876_9BACL|nr:hypothetical protein [Thermoflavimicrobium daqui]RAL26494.1 hypothetical protein DL897_00030 [Thermoflavimicrobium daqui]
MDNQDKFELVLKKLDGLQKDFEQFKQSAATKAELQTLRESAATVDDKTEANYVVLKSLLDGMENRINSKFQQIDTKFEQTDTKFAQIDARFEQIDARFEQIDARFEQIDARFEQIDARFEQIDARFEQIDARFEQIDSRFEQIDAKFEQIDTRFEQIDAKFEQVDAQFHMVFQQLKQLDEKVTNGFNQISHCLQDMQKVLILISERQDRQDERLNQQEKAIFIIQQKLRKLSGE